MAYTAACRRRRELAAARAGRGSVVRPSYGEGWAPMAPIVVCSAVLAFVLFYNTLDADFAYDDR